MLMTGPQRSTGSALAWSLGAAAVPLIAGFGLTWAMVDDALRKQNIAIGQAAVTSIDRLLDEVTGTSEALVPLLGQRCETVLPTLRAVVSENPWVRSASLLYKSKAYCHSVNGTTGAPAGPNRSVPGDLRASTLTLQHPGSSVQDHGTLRSLHDDGAHGVEVLIDNRVLVDRLDLISGSTDVAMNVNGMYLWDDGSLLRGELRQNPRYRAQTLSARYDYAMHSSVSAEDLVNLLTGKLTTLLGTLMMGSILSGGLCHWLLTRPRREL